MHKTLLVWGVHIEEVEFLDEVVPEIQNEGITKCKVKEPCHNRVRKKADEEKSIEEHQRVYSTIFDYAKQIKPNLVIDIHRGITISGVRGYGQYYAELLCPNPRIFQPLNNYDNFGTDYARPDEAIQIKELVEDVDAVIPNFRERAKQWGNPDLIAEMKQRGQPIVGMTDVWLLGLVLSDSWDYVLVEIYSNWFKLDNYNQRQKEVNFARRTIEDVIRTHQTFYSPRSP